MELAELLTIPIEELFRQLFLPFIIIFAITWGILSALRVFNKKISLILSLALSIMVIFTPQFTLFSTYIAQLGGQVAIIAFALVFGFGVIMWMFGRGRDIFEEQVASSRRVERLMKKKREYLRKAREADLSGNKRKCDDYLKRAEKIERKLKIIEK